MATRKAKKAKTARKARAPVAGYSVELAAAVCDRMIAGDLLGDICKDEGMPSMATWYRWLEAHEELRELYARARELAVRLDEDELMRVARRPPGDSVEAQHQRTLVDTLKWRLSKRLPKDYGDRQVHEHEGKVTLETLVLQSMREGPSS